jgi:Rps23 Pro-64 3,4-dihydroxylase Tpa1-like proline 4-hydroxylase
MNKKIVDIICHRLESNLDNFRKEFLSSNDNISTRFLVIDELLPRDLAMDVYNSFPKKNQMRLIRSFREKKFTFKQLNKTPELLKDIVFAIQNPKVISLIEQITGIANQRSDPSLYAGGLSLMTKNNFLNPHIDNSHDGDRKYYRTLNLLYYVSPNWKTEYGGNLELWDKKIMNAQEITSLFNRFVIMETNLHSWHSVNPVICDDNRCCVSNYYFSELSPENKEYFHVTSFSARPNQKIRRTFSKVDTILRNTARLIFKNGTGRRDIYDPK